jgi:CBS domain-containing protein
MHPIVRSFMDTETHAVEVDAPILEAVRTLLDDGVTGAPVIEDGQLVGMITEYECLRLLSAGDAEADVPRGTVRDFMRAECHVVRPDMDIYYVAGLFLAEPNCRRFPVVEGDRLVAVVTRKDILRAVGRLLSEAADS